MMCRFGWRRQRGESGRAAGVKSRTMQDLGAAQGRLLLEEDAGAARVLVGQDAVCVLESRNLLVAFRRALFRAHARICDAAREQLFPLLNRAIEKLLLRPEPFFG